jgi:erythronate-4-phosphate dehydrogenase
MLRIVADDKIPFLRGVLEPYADIIYLPGKQIDNKVLKEADALLVRTRTRCDEGLLSDTKVKFIGTATIGYDHIDTKFCENHGISWTNSPGCNSSSVQQYIASALLSIAFKKEIDLKNQTLGIIGVGNVGSKVEKLAGILGMNIILNDPPRSRNEKGIDFVNLEAVLSESDIITVHVPLSFTGEDKTYHLFNYNNFRKMKDGVWFINSSRGEVSDTNSLKRALGSGKMGGAILDVWENEPDIDLELMEKAYIATPHIAGYSTDGKANGTAMVVNSLCRYFNLSLENWYPGNVPVPTVASITVDATYKSDYDIIREVVLHTYNVEEDDIKFRSNPADFEKLRGDYQLRREFPAFTLNFNGVNSNVKNKLKQLGFNIVENADK